MNGFPCGFGLLVSPPAGAQGPPGTGGVSNVFTPVAAGATTAVVAGTNYVADSTSGTTPLTFNLSATPTDGDSFSVKFEGASFLKPARFVAAGGAIAEDLGMGAGPGSFSAANGTVGFSTVGGIVKYTYQAAGNRWVSVL